MDQPLITFNYNFSCISIMVLLIHRHLYHRTHVRGHRGGSLLNLLPVLGKAASSMLTGANLSTLAKTLGGIAIGNIASYGTTKLIQHLEHSPVNNPFPIGPIHSPQLTVGGLPQGTLYGDMLPVKNSIEVINPKNHTISLPDGNVKSTTTIIHNARSRANGGGIRKRSQAKTGGNLNKILSSKSKDILKGLVGHKGSGLNIM